MRLQGLGLLTRSDPLSLDPRFTPFVEKRPVCVLARMVLQRLFAPDRLNAVFDRTAKTGYTRKIHFATLVELMGDVVLGVRTAFQALDEDVRPAYDKRYSFRSVAVWRSV